MKIYGKRLSKYENAYKKIKAGDVIGFYYTQTKTNLNPANEPIVSYYKVLKKEHGGILIKFIYGKKGMHSNEKDFDDNPQWVRINYTNGFIYKLSKEDKIKLFPNLI